MNPIRLHLTFIYLGYFLACQTCDAQNAVVQQPTFGVSIDADGVLFAKEFPGGADLIRARVAASKARLDAKIIHPTKRRYVSLRLLDDAIEKRLSDGLQPTEEMLKLVGLLRIEFVFAFPDKNDIVIAGPAEGWIESPAKHTVGIQSGLPTLLLQDLTTALQVFSRDRPANQWFGCSIGPSHNSMQRLQAFNHSIPRTVPQGQEAIFAQKILKGTRDALGMASVVTFGIKSESHMAKRMIEADYRMKLIGIGIEPPPIKMSTFYNQIKSPPKEVLQRWWFVPNYERIGISEDRLSANLVGAGIKLLTENYDRDGKGGMQKSKRKPTAASKSYSDSFTKNFEQIAKLSSSFGQLRNATDLLVAAAFLQRENLYSKVDWQPKWISDQRIEYGPRLPIKSAPCLVNSKWKGRRFFTLAGGGISIAPFEAFKPDNLLTISKRTFAANRPAEIGDGRWWWDAK